MISPLTIVWHGCMFSPDVALTVSMMSHHQQKPILDEEQLTQAGEAGKFGKISALKSYLYCLEKIQIPVYYCR